MGRVPLGKYEALNKLQKSNSYKINNYFLHNIAHHFVARSDEFYAILRKIVKKKQIIFLLYIFLQVIIDVLILKIIINNSHIVLILKGDKVEDFKKKSRDLVLQKSWKNFMDILLI